jgi:hypothetical protein
MSSYLNQGQPCPGCTSNTANQNAQDVYQRNISQLPTGLPTSPPVSPYAQKMPPTFLQQASLMPPTFQQQTSSTSPQLQSSNLTPITPTTQPQPVTTESLQYFNGYLRTQIGRKVTVDFLIGTNTLVDKTGTLLGVGANYILINELETDDLLICDFYTIKFVKVYY